MANFLREKFDYLMNDKADPRVRDWVGFSSPALTLTIIGLYLLAIYGILPRFMDNRKPYKLTTVIFYYNILQIIYCIFLINGIATSGWTTTYSWICEPIDYSDEPNAVRMLHFCYYTYILKGIELIETVFFILRKKDNQVSNLHVYHHASTFLFGWLGVKYIGGGMASFPIMVNCFVHVLMYTYYLLASFGPEWQKKLNKWKSRLTMCQMIQFCLFFVQASQWFRPECKAPKSFLLLYLPNLALIFYMFWTFYKKSYLQKQK